MVRAKSSMFVSRRTFSLKRGWTRSPTGVRRQRTKARAAASAARSTSARGERGTSASTLAEAGLRTLRVSPAEEECQLPSMKLGKRSVMVVPLEKISFAFAGFFVAGAGFADAVHFGDFGYGDVPPGFVAGDAYGGVGFNDDDGGAVEGGRFFQSFLEFGEGGGFDGVRAEAAGIGGVIDGYLHAGAEASLA